MKNRYKFNMKEKSVIEEIFIKNRLIIGYSGLAWSASGMPATAP
jgi:hypothetical protein